MTHKFFFSQMAGWYLSVHLENEHRQKTKQKNLQSSQAGSSCFKSMHNWVIFSNIELRYFKTLYCIVSIRFSVISNDFVSVKMLCMQWWNTFSELLMWGHLLCGMPQTSIQIGYWMSVKMCTDLNLLFLLLFRYFFGITIIYLI